MKDYLCNPLAIMPASTNFNTGNILLIMILVSFCQELITMDKEVSTLRLINFTPKEYLLPHSDIFSKPHSTFVVICLTYHIRADQDPSSVSPRSFSGSLGSESFFRVLISILRSPGETRSLGSY